MPCVSGRSSHKICKPTCSTSLNKCSNPVTAFTALKFVDTTDNGFLDKTSERNILCEHIDTVFQGVPLPLSDVDAIRTAICASAPVLEGSYTITVEASENAVNVTQTGPFTVTTLSGGVCSASPDGAEVLGVSTTLAPVTSAFYNILIDGEVCLEFENISA